jgi:sphingomyelin phosphodiesterase acid-like 3
MKMPFLSGLTGLLFLTVCTSLHASTEKFISIADIHFNPFAGCRLSIKPCAIVRKLQASDYQTWGKVFSNNGPLSFAKIGEDTNYPLFKSAMTELHALNREEHTRFMLILGDSLAHTFRIQYVAYAHDRSKAGYQAFVKKTLQFIAYQFQQALPNTDIYPLVGNNDSYTGDYNSVPNGAFYHETAQTWAAGIHDATNKKNLLDTFPIGGYYAITLPGNNHQRIIMLNTVLFSTQAKGPHVDAAAKQELVWLHKELTIAQQEKQRVILAFHIPVGIDVYKTLKNGFANVTEFWKPQFSDAFKQELKTFSSTIVEILPAHIHMDALQFIMVNHDIDIPVNFTPAISPIYGNNPGFKVFIYNTGNLKIENYNTYFLPLTKNSRWIKE